MKASDSKTWPKMTGWDEFHFLTDLVLEHATADDTFISLYDHHGGTTRFANNQVVQNVDTRRVSLSVTAAFGRRRGTAGTTDLMAGAVQETLKRAERIARVSPEDPEYLSPVGPKQYLTLPTARTETTAAGPARRLEYTREAVSQCKMENLNSAGTVSSSVAAVGTAASSGLFAYEERTEARFSLTVQAGDATGWAAAAHRSIDHLKIQERTLTAIEKAKRGADEPKELPPGRYMVIMEPAAVAGFTVIPHTGSTCLLWSGAISRECVSCMVVRPPRAVRFGQVAASRMVRRTDVHALPFAILSKARWSPPNLQRPAQCSQSSENSK